VRHEKFDKGNHRSAGFEAWQWGDGEKKYSPPRESTNGCMLSAQPSDGVRARAAVSCDDLVHPRSCIGLARGEAVRTVSQR
jgi:hypothetical protein